MGANPASAVRAARSLVPPHSRLRVRQLPTATNHQAAHCSVTSVSAAAGTTVYLVASIATTTMMVMIIGMLMMVGTFSGAVSCVPYHSTRYWRNPK